MMNIFSVYFQLGIDHITDLNGYDHILFITCLTAIYLLKQWKQILILVTAFTLGHTLTLIAATFHWIIIPSNIIEFLIPVTIFITAFWNIFTKNEVGKGSHYIKYGTALFFGLIHGLGFSNYLQSLLSQEENMITSLFAFNVGIEVGQLMIVAVIIILTQIVVNLAKLPRRDWNMILSGAGMGISLTLMLDRCPF